MNNYKYNTTEILKEMEKSPDYVLNNGIWKYTGTRSANKVIIGKKIYKYKVHWIAKLFLRSWYNQGNRCTNKKLKDYKWYGNKGIKRIWNSLECVNWAINELLKRKNWNSPVISRKEDIGNYELGNVELKEMSENSKEIRVTPKSPRYGKCVKLTDVKNSNNYMVFETARKGSIFLEKKTETHISVYIRYKCNIKIDNKKYKPEYITHEEYIRLST